MGLASSIALAGLSVVNPDPNALKTAKQVAVNTEQVVVLTQKDLNELTQLVNTQNTANFNDFVKQKNKKLDILGGDEPSFRIEGNDLVFVGETGESNINEAVNYYNQASMNNPFKKISFEAIKKVLNDSTIPNNEKNKYLTILFELALKGIGFDANRVGGAGDSYSWEYHGDIDYLEKAVGELSKGNPQYENVASYFSTTPTQPANEPPANPTSQNSENTGNRTENTTKQVERTTRPRFKSVMADDVKESEQALSKKKEERKEVKQENEKKYQALSEKQKEEAKLDAELKKLKEGKGN